MLTRAYSLITVKAVDAEQRTITGMATTPTPDRMGDIVEPLGVKFANPLPLLLYHDSHLPVGHVVFGKATKSGIPFTAHIPRIEEPASLKERVDVAWASVKSGLLKAVSIGFKSIEQVFIKETNGIRFLQSEVLELSLVVIPANSEATIHTIKALDTAQRALGTAPAASRSSSPASVGVTDKRTPPMAMPISDQITTAQAELQTKSAELTGLVELEGVDGSLDDAQVVRRDALTGEVATLSGRITRLKTLEQAQGAMARTVVQRAPQGDVRDVSTPHVQMGDAPEQKLPPGIEFARAIMCQANAARSNVSAMDLAKHYYPGFKRIQQFLLKETVPAGSTLDSTWAGPLVYPTNLVSDFIEYLRPQTIIGRIDSFDRVPFNSRVTGQTSGGAGYWVGQGKAKPLTKYDFNAVTIPFTKVANITVLTEELIRFSNPSAEAKVRDQLAAACRERLDIDFIDPAKTAQTGISPASITNGITNLNSSGVTLDAVDVDVQAMMSAFINANIMPTHWIMPNSVALSLSMMRTSLGSYAFPGITMNGGTFYGLPVVTSQYCILGTPANNLIALIAAPEIFMADDGGFTIDISREASLEMDDAPTMDAGSLGSPAGASGSVTVSMFQTNSVALRCERSIYWARRRNAGVVWMDDVQWSAGTQ